MRVDRSLLNWGVFLIALGGIPLAVEQGWLESDIAGDLGRLWPLILVGIGLGLILRWTPIAWIGGALVAATFGVIFGALIVALPDDDIGGLQGIIPAIAGGACTSGEAGPARTSEGGPANATEFELAATFSCGELTVARADTARWSLEADHDEDEGPRIEESDRDGATAVLGLSQRDSDDLAFFGGRARSDWRVEVPASASLRTGFTLNAARAEVDLGSGPVRGLNGTLNASDGTFDLAAAETPERTEVNLTLNASDGTLLLPEGSLDLNVTLNASSFSVCVPAAVAVQVEISETLSSNDLGDSGLEERGSAVWSTPAFSTAGDHVLVSVSSTVSDFSLERPEACT